MPVYVWSVPSPADGCSVVQFSIYAGSLAEAAQTVRAAACAAKSTTASKLLRDGQARKAAGDELEPAKSSPGALFW